MTNKNNNDTNIEQIGDKNNNNNEVLINDKPCYLIDKEEHGFTCTYLNYYNSYETLNNGYISILITDKEDSLNWLNKIRGSSTKDMIKKNHKDNELLWEAYYNKKGTNKPNNDAILLVKIIKLIEQNNGSIDFIELVNRLNIKPVDLTIELNKLKEKYRIKDNLGYIKLYDEILINDKPCYLSIKDDGVHFNYYQPKIDTEGKYDSSIIVYTKKEVREWLKRFTNPKKKEEHKNVDNYATKLWDSLDLSKEDINNIKDEDTKRKYINIHFPSDTPYFNFELTNYDKSIIHCSDGIYYLNSEMDKKTGEILSTSKIDLLDGIFTNVKYYIDELHLLESEYEITYFNNLSESERTYKGSIKDIAKELDYEAKFIESNTDLRALLTELIHQAKHNKLYKDNEEIQTCGSEIEVINYYSLDGYFIHNNKFIDNNLYLKKLYDDKEEFIKETLSSTVNKLKDYLDFIHPNFKSICKYLLIAAYTYCFKQLNIQETNKTLYLYGKQRAGKSTNMLKLLSLYNAKKDRECSANTMASLSNDLNSLSTLPKLKDECYNLFKNDKVQELLTQSRFNIDLRTTANKDKQGTNINYKSYNTLIGTTNRGNKTFEGLNRAMLYYKFEESLNDNDKKSEYNKRFNNLDLSIIGYVFSKHIKPYMESEDIIKYDSHDGVNDLINHVLKDIEEHYDVDLKFLINIHVYDGFTEDTMIQYDYIGETLEKIRVVYNKAKRPGVMNFISEHPKTTEFKLVHNEINEPIIYYISYKNLTTLLERINKGNLLSIEEVAQYLNIPYVNVEDYTQTEIKNNYDATIYYWLPKDSQKNIFRFNSVKRGFFINEATLRRILNASSDDYSI